MRNNGFKRLEASIVHGPGKLNIPQRRGGEFITIGRIPGGFHESCIAGSGWSQAVVMKAIIREERSTVTVQWIWVGQTQGNGVWFYLPALGVDFARWNLSLPMATEPFELAILFD